MAVAACLAASPAEDGATDLTGLFMQSCNGFVGNPKGLREWAAAAALPALPPEGEAAFLHGASGRVFDASDATGKFVVASLDDGSCSAVAQLADGDAVADDLERSLRAAGIAFTLTREQDDSVEKSLHHRDYVASKDGQQWRILVGTVGDRPGAAMLTAARVR